MLLYIHTGGFSCFEKVSHWKIKNEIRVQSFVADMRASQVGWRSSQPGSREVTVTVLCVVEVAASGGGE